MITVDSAPLMDRHTSDGVPIIRRVFPSLGSRKAIEIVILGQSRDYTRFYTLRSPWDNSEPETHFVYSGLWTCTMMVTAVYEGKPLELETNWDIQIWQGNPVEISLESIAPGAIVPVGTISHETAISSGPSEQKPQLFVER